MSARSLNRVMLIGNLTRDPELRYTPQGTAVCTFGMATNRSWTPADGGERQEETEYHRIVAWSKLAEICSQLLYKGRKVYVEGRMQTRRFTGQDGNEREITEVVIDSMIALGAPKGKSDYGDETYGYEEAYEQPGTGTGSPTASAAMPASDDTGDDTTSDDASKKKKKTADTDEDIDADDIPF
jgi:single-strand DNA-binding protein